MMMEPLNIEHEAHRIEKYRDFAQRYNITQFKTFVGLYDIDELLLVMPEFPNEVEQKAFNDLIGVKGFSSYLDYFKSNNTFELIMQWREATGNFGEPLFR